MLHAHEKIMKNDGQMTKKCKKEPRIGGSNPGRLCTSPLHGVKDRYPRPLDECESRQDYAVQHISSVVI